MGQTVCGKSRQNLQESYLCYLILLFHPRWEEGKSGERSRHAVVVPRMVADSPDQNSLNQTRNPGQILDSRLPSTRVLGTSWLVFRTWSSVAWWLSSPQLRNLIRACCVPPPVTDREEKVVSAEENRKPRASLAVEDLFMLKRARAPACDALFCVGYHGNSALYRNSSRRLLKPLKLVFLIFQNGRSVRTSRGV